MSISRETIAEYYNADPEEVSCRECRYGGGEFLVECRLWGRIMGPAEFCSLWTKVDEEAGHDTVHSDGRPER